MSDTEERLASLEARIEKVEKLVTWAGDKLASNPKARQVLRMLGVELP